MPRKKDGVHVQMRTVLFSKTPLPAHDVCKEGTPPGGLDYLQVKGGNTLLPCLPPGQH